MRLRSRGFSSIFLSNWARTRLDFCSRRWLFGPLTRMILPVPVTWNRLLAPLCVFSFGMFGFLRGYVRFRLRLWLGGPGGGFGGGLGGGLLLRAGGLLGRLGFRLFLGLGRGRRQDDVHPAAFHHGLLL